MKTKIKKVLQQELDRLQPLTAWREQDGSYYLLGEYQIVPGDTVTVLHQGHERGRFHRRRAAAAWCVADRVQDKMLAYTVIQIDHEIERTQTDIQSRGLLTGDTDFHVRVNTKLQHKYSRLQQLQTELDRCVRLAKNYQRGLSK